MAELLAFTASVVAIVQIADRVVNICKFYIEAVNDSPSDLRFILLEISTLKTVLKNVQFLASCPSEKSTILGILSGQESPIEGCRQAICKLEELFPSNLETRIEQNGTKKRKFKATLAALAWPLKEKAKKLLDEILRYKSTIAVALTTENAHDIKKIKAQTSEIHTILTESKRQEILKWLYPTDPSPFHHQAQKNYEPGTGEWVLRMPEWNDWLESRRRFLWIHGIPGAGKTILISHLIEHTKQYCRQKNHQRTNKCICVYYYCYFGHNREEAVPLLRWLLNQLCRLADMIPGDVHQMYKLGSQPDLNELLKVIADLLNQFEIIYIIVDAMDESNPREDLLQTMRDFVTDARFQKIQLLASSREYIDVERIIQPISTGISMANPFVEEDIRIRVRTLIHVNPKFGRWSPELLTEVEHAVSKGAKGMFRWAVCQIDALRRLKGDISMVREALMNLPKDLDETYDRVLTMVPEEEELFVQHALQWIRFYNELYHDPSFPCALLLQAIAKSAADLDINIHARFYDVEVLQELCGCLVKVVLESKSYNTEVEVPASWIASFAHFTVQEYLDSFRVSKSSSRLSIACKEDLWRYFTRITFRNALEVNTKGCWYADRDLSNEVEMINMMAKDFEMFSVTSAFISLGMNRMHQYDDLRSLANRLLNPSEQHYQTMEEILQGLVTFLGLFYYTNVDPTALVHTQWDEEASVAEAIFLYRLVNIIVPSHQQKLILKCFLDTQSQRSVLFAHLKSISSSEVPCPPHGRYDFDGPLISLLVGSFTTTDATLELLLDHDQIPYDPSALLFDYLGRDCDPGDSDSSLIERLLRAGASPDGLEHITPLQAAVDREDLVGVERLLGAGANPNSIGNESKPCIRRFDDICRDSPLRICHRTLTNNVSNTQMQRIKALFLKYGAKDFSKAERHKILDVTDKT